jgi:hypothetical protein
MNNTIQQRTPNSLRTIPIRQWTLDSLTPDSPRTTPIGQRTPASLQTTQFDSANLIRYEIHNSTANTWFTADNTNSVVKADLPWTT